MPLPTTIAIVKAIWIIEGSHRAACPFGIMDGRPHTYQQAKVIAINTVEHAKQDFYFYHPKISFWQYLGDRYCPPECDPVGNRNWVRFMKRRFDHAHK